MKFINELKWRELVFDKTPGVEDFFSNEKVTGYVGFDPTSKSLLLSNARIELIRSAIPLH